MQSVPTPTPPLYSKTGVCRGIPISGHTYSAPKHRPRVPVRTASARRLQRAPTIHVSSKKKKKKNSKKFFTENFHSFHSFKNLRILHGQAFIMCNLLHFDHTVNLFITCWKCINVQCHRNNFHKSRK